MKYLLLGGSGFIGNHLAKELAKTDEVCIVGHSKVFTPPKGTSYKQLDFTKCTDFTNYVKDVDVVIHMISTIIPSDNLSNTNLEIAQNVFPTTSLLDGIAKFNKKIIFISSGGTVYGENNQPNTEKSPTRPISNYGISKLIIEKYIQLYHHFYDIDYRIIRLSNPYSEKIYHGKKQGVIPIIINNLINDQTIEIWGENQIRDYIHIDDVISGLLSILNYTGKERIFNLGSGSGYSVKKIVQLAEKQLHKKAKLKYCPARKCDVKKNILNIKLINQETGWKPTISLTDGIKKIINNISLKGKTNERN